MTHVWLHPHNTAYVITNPCPTPNYSPIVTGAPGHVFIVWMMRSPKITVGWWTSRFKFNSLLPNGDIGVSNTSHRWGFLQITWEQFRSEHSVLWIWKLWFWNYFHSMQSPIRKMEVLAMLKKLNSTGKTILKRTGFEKLYSVSKTHACL